MNKKFINDNIEEILIRLMSLEWYLDTLEIKDICSIQCLLKFFKKEIGNTVDTLEKFYFGFNNPDILVLEKRKPSIKRKEKETKNAGTHNKRKIKKSTKNKKIKKQNKKSLGRIQRRKVKIRK